MSNGWSRDAAHTAPQGPADWSREVASDRQFSDAAWKRLRELFDRDFAERVEP